MTKKNKPTKKFDWGGMLLFITFLLLISGAIRIYGNAPVGNPNDLPNELSETPEVLDVQMAIIEKFSWEAPLCDPPEIAKDLKRSIGIFVWTGCYEQPEKMETANNTHVYGGFAQFYISKKVHLLKMVMITPGYSYEIEHALWKKEVEGNMTAQNLLATVLGSKFETAQIPENEVHNLIDGLAFLFLNSREQIALGVLGMPDYKPILWNGISEPTCEMVQTISQIGIHGALINKMPIPKIIVLYCN